MHAQAQPQIRGDRSTAICVLLLHGYSMQHVVEAMHVIVLAVPVPGLASCTYHVQADVQAGVQALQLLLQLQCCGTNKLFAMLANWLRFASAWFAGISWDRPGSDIGMPCRTSSAASTCQHIFSTLPCDR